MTDHKAKAEKCVKWIREEYTREPHISANVLEYAAQAQVHATLYLAEQQQTANRIAYLQMALGIIRNGKATSLDQKGLQALATAAYEGLGLA